MIHSKLKFKANKQSFKADKRFRKDSLNDGASSKVEDPVLNHNYWCKANIGEKQTQRKLCTLYRQSLLLSFPDAVYFCLLNNFRVEI